MCYVDRVFTAIYGFGWLVLGFLCWVLVAEYSGHLMAMDEAEFQLAQKEYQLDKNRWTVEKYIFEYNFFSDNERNTTHEPE
jgi:hypothetical protein